MNETITIQSVGRALNKGRVLLISAGAFAGCAILSLAYGHGFRISEPGFWNGNAKERLILSIPDMFLFLGSIMLGIIALPVAVISFAFWLTPHVRNASNDNTPKS